MVLLDLQLAPRCVCARIEILRNTYNLLSFTIFTISKEDACLGEKNLFYVIIQQ